MDRRWQSSRGNVDVDFFKTWTPEMAYVLGYFSADGAMYVNSLGARYINFVSTDYDLLKKIKAILNARHEIKLKRAKNNRWRKCCWLQIGSKGLFNDLIELGLTPNKEFTLMLPAVPRPFCRHFVRGYFDGDGCVSHGHYARKNRDGKATFYLLTRFIGTSKPFLEVLWRRLSQEAGINGGSVVQRKHTTFLNALKIVESGDVAKPGLSRLPVTQEVAGSNPVVPATVIRFAT